MDLLYVAMSCMDQAYSYSRTSDNLWYNSKDIINSRDIPILRIIGIITLLGPTQSEMINPSPGQPMGSHATPQHQKISWRSTIHPAALLYFRLSCFSLSNSVHTSTSQSNMSSLDRANEAVSFLTKSLPEGLRKPQVAIVCGSGLGGLAETVQSEPRAEFDYTSIPHFPRPTGILIFQHLLSTFGRKLIVKQSRWSCGEIGVWTSWPEDSCRLDGWPCTVRLRLSLRLLLLNGIPC